MWNRRRRKWSFCWRCPFGNGGRVLTFFTTAKAFRGHDGIIQRNALGSWKQLHPDAEVILFGDEEGAAEACAEFGLRHEAHVERHESRTKRLDYIFSRAQEISRHEYCCFVNCDIILLMDFREAFEKARAWRERFLFVAQRWDVDIKESIDFGDAQWSDKLRQLAETTAFRQDEFWIDLFLFRKGQYSDMPPLLVGHCYWDNWMIWKALRDQIPVLDGTPFVMPIHQNHGYNPEFGRMKGFPNDALSLHNLELIGGKSRIRHIKSATHRMWSSGRIHKRLLRPLHHRVVRQFLGKERNWLRYRVWLPMWHSLLKATRPLRNSLGLRSQSSRLRSRASSSVGNGE
jgi:hypothetical protein